MIICLLLLVALQCESLCVIGDCEFGDCSLTKSEGHPGISSPWSKQELKYTSKMAEKASLEDILAKRAVSRQRFTRHHKTVNTHLLKCDQLIQSNSPQQDIVLEVRNAVTAMTQMEKVFSELQEVQDQIDYDPEEQERLDKMDPPTKSREDENEEKYRDSYVDVNSKIQTLEQQYLSSGQSGQSGQSSPIGSASGSAASSITAAQLTQSLKEAFKSINTGITGEQLKEIMGTVTQKKREINIPKFKGELELYDQWCELIEAEFEKPGYSAPEKAHYATSLLEGEPRKIVAALKEPTYEDIIAALDKKYGDVLTKVQQAIQEFANMKPATNMSVADMDTEKEPQEYRMTTVVFGLTSSPFSSIKTVLKHAETKEKEFPQAVQEITDNIFVDDILSGGETVKEAAKLAVDLKTVLATGGFPLRKFISNKRDALKSLEQEELASHHSVLLTDEEFTTKTLGVKYVPSEDVLMFSYCDKMENIKTETRRTVLKQLHRVYDPMGMLSPFTLKAKQIFQRSWIQTGDWDDPLPEELACTWKKWKEEVSLLDEIMVQRCIVPGDFKKPSYSLHAFGDACEAAYGAVVYLRRGGSQRLEKQFWSRWTKEYLLELNQLKKWTEIQTSIKVDDVVLISDDNVRKLQWILGRVTEVHIGRDNLVRSVTVKTANGSLRRPVQKLRLLESADEMK